VHELSLASAVVDTVERHADGRRVRVISLRVGALRQVVPESLELYVDLVGRGTVCEGARLELELVRARLACCGGEWEPPSFRCPKCGGGGRVVSGDEFLVESIQVVDVGSTESKDAEVEACIARW
jgi:hydrogenase nickel incorporation protein HypA/HybF